MCVLDSIVYYVSNAILQMKNLNEDNLELILPMVKYGFTNNILVFLGIG